MNNRTGTKLVSSVHNFLGVSIITVADQEVDFLFEEWGSPSSKIKCEKGWFFVFRERNGQVN